MIKTIPLLPQRKNAETMKLQIIDTGYFYADGGAMFGAIPKSAWSRRYPSDETNGCVLAMRSLVIKTDDGRIVSGGLGGIGLRFDLVLRAPNMLVLVVVMLTVL